MNILYKYKPFDQNTLSLLINRTLYFPSPETLNDPYDCQIGIQTNLESAFSHDTIREMILDKLSQPKKFKGDPTKLFNKIEDRLKSVGVLCFSHENDNVLMWSHYADKHYGLCLAFDLSDKLREPSQLNGGTYGTIDCIYTDADTNPFRNYLSKPTTQEEKLEYERLVLALVLIGAHAKSKKWEHENEARIIKMEPGEVTFEPTELREIIFGMRMTNRNKLTIRTLLSGTEWKHIDYSEVQPGNDGFSLRIVPA